VIRELEDMEPSRPRVLPRFAVAALLTAVALSLSGTLVWNMTTTAYYGEPGHFTRGEDQRVYPRRAQALWITAGLFGVLGVAAAIASRRTTARPHAL
jgi:hypothetical protein